MSDTVDKAISAIETPIDKPQKAPPAFASDATPSRKQRRQMAMAMQAADPKRTDRKSIPSFPSIESMEARKRRWDRKLMEISQTFERALAMLEKPLVLENH